MKANALTTLGFVAVLLGLAPVHVAGAQAPNADLAPVVAESSSYRDDATTQTFRLLGKNTIWTKVNQVAVDFTTFHTEGLVKIGDTLFVSAVEVLESTVK